MLVTGGMAEALKVPQPKDSVAGPIGLRGADRIGIV